MTASRRSRSACPRSANSRWRRTYSALPSGVSMRHRRVAPVREVVRRGLHVEGADVARVLEGVEEQVAGHERAELDRPFVEVHAGVQASGLLERRLTLARRRVAVAGHRLGCEEAEGVEVRAAQVVRLDHRVGRLLPEPQRHVMAVLALPVDHRPLVEPEASEAAGAAGRGAQDPADVLRSARRLSAR